MKYKLLITGKKKVNNCLKKQITTSYDLTFVDGFPSKPHASHVALDY